LPSREGEKGKKGVGRKYARGKARFFPKNKKKRRKRKEGIWGGDTIVTIKRAGKEEGDSRQTPFPFLRRGDGKRGENHAA